MKPTHIHKFTANDRLYPLLALREYLSATFTIGQGNTSLFMTTVKPHKPTSSSTISSRWVKTTMGLAGIDISTYKAHSTRFALHPKLHKPELILKVADWPNAQTFQSFYHRKLYNTAENVHSQPTKSFTTTVLSQISLSDEDQD
ncbi:hypothetical protein LOD99_1047 [Oopsacas minuta]|uniref:Tyr recombinase domain-containing protein n=1 Tax=Oopsacas minuta TaxID=111878 RepID=A0AAV7K131_9METZ|nr:hypothetical protein LOD99_1047 [Oopsacas minuta]